MTETKNAKAVVGKIAIAAAVALALIAIVVAKTRQGGSGDATAGAKTETRIVAASGHAEAQAASESSESAATPDGAPTGDAVVEDTGALPRLVDLGADKCIPCKAMAPILDELKENYAGRFDVTFIDVWKNPEAGNAYNVRMIPTQVFFDAEGNEVFRHEGFFSRDDILGKWRELGYTFAESNDAG